MATMVKEKRKEKKRSKEKYNKTVTESQSLANQPILLYEEEVSLLEVEADSTAATSESIHQQTEIVENVDQFETGTESAQYVTQCSNELSEVEPISLKSNISYGTADIESSNSEVHNDYIQSIKSIENVNLSDADVSLASEATECNQDSLTTQVILESSAPSAPMLHEEIQHIPSLKQESKVNESEVIYLKSMPLEEAIKLFGGAEIAEVMAMSEREEAIVESGPRSGPEHPLVDLLSTFRRSLIAVENERIQLTNGVAEEEKFRSTLWEICEKYIHEVTKCSCGRSVTFRAKYEHAHFQTNKLPIARLKLKALLKDVQESYCHHQHEALLAHYQIEDFISETMKSHKGEIREALTLVLQALKQCADAPPVLAGALQRWARALSTALLDQRDVRQLLFLIHHLFRQTRSVRWAASVIRVSVTDDGPGAARAVALMELLFARTKLEAAVECVEEDAWEEVDKEGGGGAVSDDSLREQDLLALLRALPVRELVSRLLLMHADVSQAREFHWGDGSARGVLRACCGVRALLRCLALAVAARARYKRLQQELRGVAKYAIQALAALHEHASPTYTPDIELKVLGELQAVFVSGLELLADDSHELPASLLAGHAARDYCAAHAACVRDHADSVTSVPSLGVALPQRSCDARVRIVSNAAVARRKDYELACFVLDFLFHTGTKRVAVGVACKGACRQAARECLPDVLGAFPYLYPMALHLVADTHQDGKLEPSYISCLSMEAWRPNSGELRAVLDDWALRCGTLLPPLLLRLHCGPHDGVSLESQLALGSWLCEYVRSRPGDPHEWCWKVLCRLRVHRTGWGVVCDAPPPEPHPTDTFSKAYALVASSWGHCIPLICSNGVDALCALAAVRPLVAVHCLAPIMLVLAHSPESVATTPRFTELLTTLMNAGPSLVQRALGRGGAPPADALLHLLRLQLRPDGCGAVPRAALVSVWVAALWRSSPALATLLDAAMARPRCPQLDHHAQGLARATDEESQQYIQHAMKWYAQAPFVCEHAIRAWHTQQEVRTRMCPRLLDALHMQRNSSQRIHVDNALKSVGVTGSSEQLAIYRAAEAVTSSASTHPAHTLLWRLLMQLYLQTAPSDTRNNASPIGPLFFSGIIKSRTLAQLKRRLQDNIKYHSTEADNLKIQKEKPDTQTVPVPPQRSKSKSQTPDFNLTSPLSINDLTGESSESDPDCDLSEEEIEVIEQESVAAASGGVADLLAYHVGAKRMFQEYARWLDEGEKTRAQCHHAEIGRFIPEQALDAVFKHESQRRLSTVSADMEPLPLPPDHTPTHAPPLPPAPFHMATKALLRIRGLSRRRTRNETIKSPLQDVQHRDARAVLLLVERHLADIEQLSREWCKESGAVLKLDDQLWDLVKGLRVSRPLCVLRATCANRCEQLQMVPMGREWCISTNAQQGIIENRRSARQALRRLARARPHAARSAAALLALARCSGSLQLARRIAESVWRSASTVSEQCAPAAAVLTALVELIAERWLWHDGVTCASLISRWCSRAPSPLQCGAAALLVAPARCPPQQAPLLHAALLAASLPPPVLFQALSKFELSKWSQLVDAKARHDMLDSLVASAQRWGPTPDEDQQQLVELTGVQMASVCTATELCALACACARACAMCALPAAIVPHVERAAGKCAKGVPFDQLGHLLRELGVAWWEARAHPSLDLERVACYAPHFAKLLTTLHGAFVAAAVALSYAPEKVGVVSWASLVEAWSPWVSPGAPPRLPPGLTRGVDHAVMLQSLRHAARQIVAACPGVEEVLLSQVWEWVVQTHQLVVTSPTQDGRVQVSSLLATLAELPWANHQWLSAGNLQTLLQVSQCGDEEMLQWCARCCSELDIHSWLRGEEQSPAPRLAALLYLFTASPWMPLDQTLSTACLLPWSRLPEAALDSALEQFLQHHHGLAAPYHDLLQFKVILAASELSCPPVGVGVGVGSSSRDKRARCVSAWTRAAAAPELIAHVPKHVDALARTLAAIAPHLEQSVGELADLLSRALVITCLEPAAAHAAPVWERFISSSEPPFVRASLQATAGLTAFEYFATLSEAAVAAHLRQGGDWSTVVSLRQACVWHEPAPLCARARPYAAYAAHAHSGAQADTRAALLALLAADIDFKKNDAIVAAWICLACRCALAGAGAGAGAECLGAARTLLARWGDAPRGLLRLVIATNEPTAEHRLLCLLAQCVISPGNDGAARAFESACVSVISSSPDVAAWGKAPHPKRLPRLAMRLYPHAENYFKLELDLAPEGNIP